MLQKLLGEKQLQKKLFTLEKKARFQYWKHTITSTTDNSQEHHKV